MYKLAQSSDSGEMTALKIRNHIIYNWMVAEKGFDEKFGQSNNEFVDKILDSSLTIINAETSPLTVSDKIHCLLELVWLTDSPKLIKVVEEVLTNSSFEDWTNECAIDAFMLLVNSNLHKKLPGQYELILTQLSRQNRVYDINEVRSLVVYINQNKNLQGDVLLQEAAQMLYESNLSSIMSRTDIATLHHFITFFKTMKVDLQKHYMGKNVNFHSKISKIAMKRLNRLLIPKNDDSETRMTVKPQNDEDTINLELLKILEVFGKLEY
jgi:hypothetical protein